MDKYKVKYKERHIVIRTFWDEFDTSDQAKWQSLLENAANYLDEDELAKFPEKAPSDLDSWLKLYMSMGRDEYENEEEEYWFTEVKTGPEVMMMVEDSNGNIVYEDEYQ